MLSLNDYHYNGHSAQSKITVKYMSRKLESIGCQGDIDRKVMVPIAARII